MARELEKWWPGNPTAARRRLRQGCRYYAYIPDPLAHLELSLPVELTADISDAERDIEHLNTETPSRSWKVRRIRRSPRVEVAHPTSTVSHTASGGLARHGYCWHQSCGPPSVR